MSGTRVAQGLALALLYLYLALAVFIGVALALPYGDSLKDFGSFLAAGRAAAQGANPYAVTNDTLPGIDLRLFGQNLNPPISVLAFQGMPHWDPFAMLRAWFMLSIVAYLLVVILLARSYPRQRMALLVPWSLGLAGFWADLDMGQIYMPLLLAGAAAWLLLRRGRYVVAGLLIGVVVAFKPNFIVWPALLFFAGYRATALSAAISAGVLSLAPLAVYGPGIYARWLAALPGAESLAKPTNASLFGPLSRLGMPWAAYLLGAALLVALVIWAWRSRPAALSVSALAIVASLLVSPIAWVSYTLFLLPVFFHRPWTRLLTVAGILLLTPYLLTWGWPEATLHSLVLGSVYFCALLLVLAQLVMDALPTARPAAPPSYRPGSRPALPPPAAA